MKRIVAVALSLVILALPFDAFADASWWNNTGSQEAAPTEKPPNLFSGLLGTLRGKDPDSPDDPPSIEDPDENYDDYDGDGYVNNDFWENALFGPWVGDITAKPYGGEVRYTQINDWTIAYGNCDNRFCVFGWDGNTNSYKILADTNVSGIVAAGDSFVYYGEVKKGKFGWMIRNPDQEKPVSLGLNELNSVFWSDEEYLYYFTYGKTNTYWRMDHDGKHKKQLGKISGRAIAMLENGAVLVFNSIKNRVERWKDGKDTTIYEPKEDICNVISTGREIWIVHPDYLGLLEDGEITFKISGDLRDYAMTRDQLFIVMDQKNGSGQFDLWMLNDAYRAYTSLGGIAEQEYVTMEVTPGYYNRLVAWGPVESLSLIPPFADGYLPYGFYDMASAKAAGYEGWRGYEGDGIIPEPEIGD